MKTFAFRRSLSLLISVFQSFRNGRNIVEEDLNNRTYIFMFPEHQLHSYVSKRSQIAFFSGFTILFTLNFSSFDFWIESTLAKRSNALNPYLWINWQCRKLDSKQKVKVFRFQTFSNNIVKDSIFHSSTKMNVDVYKLILKYIWSVCVCVCAWEHKVSISHTFALTPYGSSSYNLKGCCFSYEIVFLYFFFVLFLFLEFEFLRHDKVSHAQIFDV